LELGIELRIEEYRGSKPIAQYILATNIRRNLTKLQRHQLIADFASEIIPQINAEIQKGRKPDSERTGLMRENSPALNSVRHPARQFLMNATGASEDEARHLKSIHDKAPELLAELTQSCTILERSLRRYAFCLQAFEQ
jgi:hypothetical protein